MNLISSEEALNAIAFSLFYGVPIIILLLIWIGINVKKIKDNLKK
jgi:hypothetical protein